MASLHYFSRPPRSELAPFVESIWGVRGLGQYSVESILPTGAVDLMVNFGPTQAVVAYGDAEADDAFDHSWVAGIQNQRLVHASPNGTDHIAVRFRPGGAHAFLGVPMDELTNRVVALDALMGAGAEALRASLLEAGTDEARCGAIEDWLIARRRVDPGFATVRDALRYLRAVPARTSVADLCERLGLSNRHLVAQFRRTVGLPPKPVARIHRFQAVIEACRGRTRVGWAATAARFGYADQSHLIREFRRLGGITPTQFLQQRTPDESHVIVG